MKTILVFKTSVSKKDDVQNLKAVLKNSLQKKERWNFDLEDCDHILRVESRSTKADTVVAALQNMGFNCQELED